MENKSYNELKEVIGKGDWKAMHESFGCHLATKVDAKYLNKRASEMIERCNVWIANWKQVREGIKPELQAARAEHFAEKLQELDSYSEEELDELLKKVEALKTA